MQGCACAHILHLQIIHHTMGLQFAIKHFGIAKASLHSHQAYDATASINQQCCNKSSEIHAAYLLTQSIVLCISLPLTMHAAEVMTLIQLGDVDHRHDCRMCYCSLSGVGPLTLGALANSFPSFLVLPPASPRVATLTAVFPPA